MTHHKLKTESSFFKDVQAGLKTFEYRLNDRNFKVGDLVTLVEVENGVPTSREQPAKEIKYILHGGLLCVSMPETHCILQL